MLMRVPSPRRKHVGTLSRPRPPKLVPAADQDEIAQVAAAFSAFLFEGLADSEVDPLKVYGVRE